VRRELKERKASTSKSKNKIVVDLSELLRIYAPEELNFDILTGKSIKQEENESSSTQSVMVNSESGGEQVLKEKINSKEKEIELLGKQLEREREINDDLKEALQKSQNHETRLLEYRKTEEGAGKELLQALKPIQDEISQLKSASEIEKTKSEDLVTENTDLAKQKNDLKKANKVYAGLAFIVVVGVGIFAQMQSRIIQIN